MRTIPFTEQIPSKRLASLGAVHTSVMPSGRWSQARTRGEGGEETARPSPPEHRHRRKVALLLGALLASR